MARLFVGFPVPSVVPLELQRKFNAYDLTSVKEFHLTLKFLGEVSEHDIPDIILQLSSVRASLPALSFSHLGTFSDFSGKPRVLWVALRPEDALLQLHDSIDRALHGLFPKDIKYAPHLTLGRFRSDKNISALPSVLSMKPPAFTFLIKEFCLYKSKQQVNGSYAHTILARFPLHS